IVHEINNPLGIIAGYNRVISRLSDDQEVSHATKKIESTIGRMEKIMHGLLHFSHNDENESFDVVRAESYMDQIQGIVTIRLKKFYIPLEIIYEKLGRDATFACRSIQFSQVIVILVNNAIDAISGREASERWIKIYCSVDKEFAEFRVVDSGGGVPDELKAKIMDPYFTTKSTGEGTGLGLSIASKIVKGHGGTIEVSSGLPSTFCVRIPVKNPETS
ncbi:MAG: HAMP domain-containing histidine kinase, partial [Cytophagales bacterium]|nr:HAMP domain-containing histidine kinase [Cytophagales bacterium]